ncbi:MAG: ELWxxDGT repeat protein [Chloroflexota bacterium]
MGDRLFFVTLDGVGDPEALWVSDGTQDGTHRVRSVPARDLVAFGDRLLFWGHDASHGWEPWVSDGTKAGTTEVLADAWLAAARPAAAVLGDRLLFAASTSTSKGDVLWTTDGTAGGTHRVVGGSVVRDVAGLVESGDRVVFAGSSAQGLEPWVTDGSRAGTSMLADLNTDTLGSLPTWDSSLEDADAATGFVALGSRRYFVADDGVHGRELWRTDGTSDRTRLVADIRAGSAGSSPSLPVVAGDRLYFSADDGTHGRELWVSDGTAGGTRLVRDIRSGASDSSPYQLTAVGDRVVFETGDQSLWVSDGTAAGTLRLKRAADAHGGSTGVAAMVSTGPVAYLVWDTMRPDCDEFAEICTVEHLWVTDGTTGGTRQVSATDVSPIQEMVPFGPGVAFVSGTQLWASDGTSDGTRAVRSFQRLGALASLGDRLVFHGCRASTGCEPWVSDGTTAGTHLLADVVPGTEGSEPRQFVVVGDRVFLSAFAEGADRLSLWVTDGTADGTSQVLDLAPARAAAVGDRLVFAADDGDAGWEPWVSDGTPDGTRMLADLHPYRDSDPYGFAPLGSGVLMAADDGDHGTEPWYLALP